MDHSEVSPLSLTPTLFEYVNILTVVSSPEVIADIVATAQVTFDPKVFASSISKLIGLQRFQEAQSLLENAVILVSINNDADWKTILQTAGSISALPNYLEAHITESQDKLIANYLKFFGLSFPHKFSTLDFESQIRRIANIVLSGLPITGMDLQKVITRLNQEKVKESSAHDDIWTSVGPSGSDFDD